MFRRIDRVVVVALALFATTSSLISAGIPALVPQPLKMEAREGSFSIKNDTVIFYSDISAKDVAEYLSGILAGSTGMKLRTENSSKADKGILLKLSPPDPALGDEGYNLDVTADSAVVTASTPAGLFYGVQTILQLLPPEVLSRKTVDNIKWNIPAVSIRDKPEYKWRGLMLDSGRYFQPVDFVKKFIDIMALHKMNTLQIHLTDDQGWRIEIKKYPKLTELGSIRKESPKRGNRNTGDGVPYGPKFYTQAELRDIVAYAATRFITVVPEIEMPGHGLAALVAYPELSCTGGPFHVRTKWGVEEDVYCAGNDQVYKFNEDILTEVMAIFPGKFIHVGGDECPKSRWNKCPKCQARIKTEGLKNAHQLQSYFITRMEKLINSKGKRLIGWDEILEGGLAPNAAVMSWRGEGGGISAANQGHDVVMSPTSYCYLDYAQAKGPNEPESIGGLLSLEKVYSYKPTPAGIADDKKQHILGVQGNLWSEYLWDTDKVEYMAFPRGCALAEVAWAPATAKNYDDFLSRMEQHVKRLDMLKVNYRKLTPAAKPVGSWKSGGTTEQWAGKEWDLSRSITKAGKLELMFQYTGGTHKGR